MKSLSEADLQLLLDRALSFSKLAPNSETIVVDPQVQKMFIAAADGDARRVLNFLEVSINLAKNDNETLLIDYGVATNAIGSAIRQFDKRGDHFFDQISALHKAVRGTDPDAALYWLARMLDGGCDPRYIARRLVRMASEDIGNADPRALAISLDALEAFERLGSPEGELALAQATVFLACAAKSNATYVAFNKAKLDVAESRTHEVPIHLRNATTNLAKKLGYSQGYIYPHDQEDGYVTDQSYFPEDLGDRRYYHPVKRGLETRIAEKLAELRAKKSRGR